MPKITATRGSQYPLFAEFTFNFDDTMVDVGGATKNFKTAGTTVVDAINLPPNAVILSGEVVTETAVAGATTYTLAVGDAVTPERYLAATAASAIGTTPLEPTGYVGNGEQIRLTLNVAGTPTAGKVTVRVMYIIRGRVNEAQTH